MKGKHRFIMGVAAIALVFSTTLLTGCATLFKGDTQVIPVTSDVEGAEVLVNGVPYGKTPLQLRLKTNKTYTIIVRKGDRERTFTITNSIGAQWVILDILGGLIPVIIDASTGAWYELQPGQINVVLQ